ncbi:bifunctional acetate--CoA ligase family protein/GNAT family N-acetyltransferase [Ottowia sp. SB7-C50]|uniref:bifunctional acetate--CoA ligase family protein/GNAT family N-acetyltransferase n=1 Tax=Ottowia sp. SB7-C50 TaxID=3081231 RepID=UPI002954C923|nr:bifunctional acetate--CoA ligase family protein/GNAT family N-acetyltransferase [Ottowia sp. SB7-C50]WOP14996.1 bifunctional acetate--CoA ligase family protein/GNAT family N-acetyltransferase [Ottowia sp. SB7-C50]
MSIRNLDSLFDPASVAVIGASERPFSVGGTLWRNMRTSGFGGRIFPVNPKYQALSGQRCYARVDDLPEVPEMAVICTPAGTVVDLIGQLAQRGTKAAVVISAGLTAEQKQAMLDAAKPALLRILGPNCVGLLSPHAKLNASFAHIPARPGALAFVSQSGALVTAMLDWAEARNVGFSHFVSLGEHADVDFGDMLDYLASDPHTRAILLYIESIDQARKFMSAARAAARNKPVIVIKAGRSAQGQKAAASHTGALAGADNVVDAAIARAGMLRVNSLEELFLAAEILTRFKAPIGDRMTVLTNGGGVGVLAADAAAAHGVPLAELGQPLLNELDKVLPANWSHGNPVDIIGDAPAQRYVDALTALARHPEDTGTLLFIQAPTAIVPSTDIARALIPVIRPEGHAPLPLVSSWVGGPAVAEARALFTDAGIACYDLPEQAVAAIGLLQAYGRNQAELAEAPPAELLHNGSTPDVARVREIVAQVLASGRDMLTEPEAKAVCEAYHIPVVATRTVPANAVAAADEAARIGFPVVLKILSEDISHKSDVGGVALNLNDEGDVRAAAQAMLVRVGKSHPDARVEGFTVQKMVKMPQSQELIIGASIDPTFGPVILFGQGGTAVEVMKDSAMALPPLNAPLARALIERTRVAKLLHGYRDVPPADIDAVIATLMAVSQLLADVPEVAELDINPLIVNHQGAIALDARVRVSSKQPAGAAHFAIAPYPAELSETIDWRGQPLTIRPIRPEDEERHRAFLESLDPEDIRMRLFYSRRTMERSELARLVQIDYTREMAFVATVPDGDGGEKTVGVARALADPDNVGAEFGIIVRPEMKGSGLGRLLMDKLIRHQRAAGTRQLTATVLTENHRMRKLGHALGMREQPVPGDTSTLALVLDLQPGA